MSDPFIGEIRPMANNFAPSGWSLCHGQIVPISEFAALFNLIGTTYGGDGQTTFALPDLRGRTPVHAGTGPSLSSYTIGQAAGTESVALSVGQLPSHTHTARGTDAAATIATPGGNLWAREGSGTTGSFSAAPDANMASEAISSSGGSQNHTNLQPYLVINFIIALEGIFPASN